MKNYSNRDTNKYRRWKAVIAILLAFVVAMTTYDFMVPTFALTDDSSQEQMVRNAESDVDSDSDAPEAEEEPAVETDEDGIGTDEDINAADADSDAEADEPGEDNQEADADFNAKATETTLRVKDKTYTVEVTYGEEAGVPDEAELTVEEIDKTMNEFDEYMARTEEAVGEDLAVDFARFFDIKIMNGEEDRFRRIRSRSG